MFRATSIAAASVPSVSGAARPPSRRGLRVLGPASLPALRAVKNLRRSGGRQQMQLSALFGMFGKPDKLPEAKDCLPGRDTEMRITNTHYITKNPIKGPFPDNLEVVVFGTGCFWGTEKGFWRIPGVYSTAVGYASGHTPNPAYEEVCSGRTGHNEVVQVVWDPTKVSFADLLRLFWASHDPTQGMRQGNDAGTQYRSGIYYQTAEQKALAEASMASYQAYGSTHLQESLTAKGYGKITTELVENPTFYFAEDYHQQYLAKPGARPYCSAQPTGIQLAPFDTWCPAGMESYAPKVPEGYWKEHGPRPGCTIGFPNEQVAMTV